MAIELLGTRGLAGQRMKLLIDMNLSPRWIGLLNNSGVDAVLVSAGLFVKRIVSAVLTEKAVRTDQLFLSFVMGAAGNGLQGIR